MRSRLLIPRSFGRGRGSVSRIEGYLPCGRYSLYGQGTGTTQADKLEPCRIASKAIWLGAVEAPEEAAAEYKVPATSRYSVEATTRRKGKSPSRVRSVIRSGRIAQGQRDWHFM